MATPVVTCLSTIVENPTSTTQFYAGLGDHGVLLAAGATRTLTGDIFAAASRRGPSAVRSLEAALTNGTLAIRQTPAPHLWDANRARVRLLSCNNNVLGITGPCWDTAGDSHTNA